jgi:ribosomal protein L44E
MENTTATGRIHACVPAVGKPPSKAKYLNLTWKVDSCEAHPDYKEKEIRFDNVMYGGEAKSGDPINTDRFAKLLECASIPWECEECHNGMQSREFLRGTGTDTEKGENGLPKGKYFCPDCRAHMNVGFDTDNFPGRTCMIAITSDGEDDKKFNKVKDYGPIV